MLHNRKMVPFLSGQQKMTHYDIDSSPFYFTRECVPWHQDPQTAALNCFADGGTNAHVILEAYTQQRMSPVTRKRLNPPRLNRKPMALSTGAKDNFKPTFWKRIPMDASQPKIRSLSN